MPEQLIAVPAVLIIGLHSTFLFTYLLKKTKISWHLPLPLLAGLIYVPYEAYFAQPEVSLSVPIRVDLLLIVPLTTVSLPLNAYCWFCKMRWHFAEIRNGTRGKSVCLLTVSVVMLLLASVGTVLWVSAVLRYIVWVAIQIVKDVQKL